MSSISHKFVFASGGAFVAALSDWNATHSTSVAKGDISGAPTGNFVGTSDTQELSNKTLYEPQIGTGTATAGFITVGLPAGHIAAMRVDNVADGFAGFYIMPRGGAGINALPSSGYQTTFTSAYLGPRGVFESFNYTTASHAIRFGYECNNASVFPVHFMMSPTGGVGIVGAIETDGTFLWRYLLRLRDQDGTPVDDVTLRVIDGSLQILNSSANSVALISGSSIGAHGVDKLNAGTLGVARGGTGIANFSSGDIIYASALDTLSALTRGSNGQVLKLTAGFPAWATEGGGTTHNILSATHTDSLAASVARGDTIIGNSTPAWARLAVGANNTYLKSNGTDPSWASISQDHLVVWSLGGSSTTGTNVSAEVRMPISGTVIRADASVKVAPSGSNMIFDINLAGTSIWNTSQSNRLTVAAGSTTGSSTYFDTTSFGTGQYFTLDIDQIGSNVAGTAPTVLLYITFP